MTEQQQHLQSAIQQRESLVQEIQNITNVVGEKRELVFKLQGIIEYLQQMGVTLPETEAEFTEEDVQKNTEE
jgi:hypothetical protein